MRLWMHRRGGLGAKRVLRHVLGAGGSFLFFQSSRCALTSSALQKPLRQSSILNFLRSGSPPVREHISSCYEDVQLPHIPIHISVDGNRIPRWDRLSAVLLRPIHCIEDFQESLTVVNAGHPIDVEGLRSFLTEHCSPDECSVIFQSILPKIVELALRVESLCPLPQSPERGPPGPAGMAAPPPPAADRPGVTSTPFTSLPRMVPLGPGAPAPIRVESRTFTQLQAACLLANAFLCAFPGRNTTYRGLPSFSFRRLFGALGWEAGAVYRGVLPACTGPQASKLQAFLHYFLRAVMRYMSLPSNHPWLVRVGAAPKGSLTIERRALDVPPDWAHSPAPLCPLEIAWTGLIEDSPPEALRVDFANKLVGGGVLGNGAVQEEILFTIFPELLLTRLLCEELDDCETLVMRGVERFSRYSGYSDTFAYTADFVDQAPISAGARLRCPASSPRALRREINKVRHLPPPHPVPSPGLPESTAFSCVPILSREFTSLSRRAAALPFPVPAMLQAYCGFSAARPGQPVATGHWGCGAFHGQPELKAIVQLMALSHHQLAQRTPPDPAAPAPAAPTPGRLLYSVVGDASFGERLAGLHETLTAQAVTVGQLWEALLDYGTLLADARRRPCPAATPQLAGATAEPAAAPAPAPARPSGLFRYLLVRFSPPGAAIPPEAPADPAATLPTALGPLNDEAEAAASVEASPAPSCSPPSSDEAASTPAPASAPVGAVGMVVHPRGRPEGLAGDCTDESHTCKRARREDEAAPAAPAEDPAPSWSQSSIEAHLAEQGPPMGEPEAAACPPIGTRDDGPAPTAGQ
ncbi:putative poly glycohydrolase family protein [Paratrimastix pyriformis]|uniref:poly(ADP-ribose) glycohydrolase n=1 Tax=Paratrimastix pyriformis TaxID=342808 RepID=A0ABQ8UMY2_9EUKA|nr:putative poly glycohydrolase family protein [Paratrimastix pyriformis]